MIKLNNKNITYVALADSNNSTIGVKEIWYADTNNSVKLVYRRKDALIEGVDYEKYHWLVGDADAYINTLKYYRPYDDSVQMTFRDNLYPNRESKYNKYHNEEQIWGACETNNLQSVLIRSYISGPSAPNSFCNNIIDGNTSDSSVNWGTYATQNPINESPEHSLYISSVNNEDRYYFIYNGNTKNNLPTRYKLPELVQQDVRIFYSGIHDNGYFNGSFFNFIHYRNNVEITHLIPCKLLKPVPKWLDANGIRRQVGECGMIDLVSGKFYGNVNSVGTFTVENYYERKEWLQGRNGAYIDTNHKAYACKDKYICHFAWDGSESNPENKLNGIFGCKNGDTYIRAGIRAGKFYFDYANCPPFNAQISISQPYEGTVEMYSDESSGNSIVIYNGVTNTFSNNSLSKGELLKNVMVFENIANNNTYFQGDISSFKILDTDNADATIMNLIPCTLTMDLPASMDANNIARTKGTSGMWDLVSDKFYGNVANSGTFKAVNLAEGVDYEVHQWLVGDGNAYINTLITKFDGIVDISFYFSSYNGSIFGRERKDSSIEDYSDRFVVSINNNVTPNCRIYGKDTNGAELPIANDERLIIDINNGVATNKNGDTAIISVMANVTGRNLYLFADNYRDNPYINKFNGRIGLFSISNKIYLIPVKLLHSIPSKYDANGIARQAGECGMYDTVNDVFYGNVASSGTFSVSDDE
jgi:hypothetical protein